MICIENKLDICWSIQQPNVTITARSAGYNTPTTEVMKLLFFFFLFSSCAKGKRFSIIVSVAAAAFISETQSKQHKKKKKIVFPSHRLLSFNSDVSARENIYEDSPDLLKSQESEFVHVAK